MKPIRMVVIDDSKAVRKIIAAAVEGDPEIQVVGEAADGREGVELVRQVRPDVISLDVEMPVLNGLDALSEIRSFDRTVPVIMFSALTKQGSRAVMEALSRGATDYQLKPTGVDGYTDAISRLRADLVPKIKALGRKAPAPPPAAPAPAAGRSGSAAGAASTASAAPAAPRLAKPRSPGRPIEAVVLASSTGGPSALEVVLSHLDPRVDVPILIVQHIPPMFSAILAERLDANCHMKVVEASNGMKVERGHVYIAPGGLHMKVKRTDRQLSLTTDESAPVNSCRPAADVLFTSAAPVFRDAALGVVLTGMGQDGLAGCRELATNGASILTQDEATSVVWGMPGFVTRAGLAAEVVPLPEMAAAISRWVVPSPRAARAEQPTEPARR